MSIINFPHLGVQRIPPILCMTRGTNAKLPDALAEGL